MNMSIPSFVLPRLARSSAVDQAKSRLHAVVARHSAADAGAAADDDDDDAGSLPAVDHSTAAPEHECISHAAPRISAT